MSDPSKSPPDGLTVDQTRALFLAHFAGPDKGVPKKWDELWSSWDESSNGALPFDKGVFNPALEEVLSLHETGIVPGAFEGRVEADAVGVGKDGVKGKDGRGKVGEDGERTEGKRERKRRKALVPGCGKGYDVFLLSAYGYDATGVEISERAVQEAEAEWARVQKTIGNGKEGDAAKLYGVRDEEVGKGEVKFVVADFFELNEAGEKGEEGWDLIYDYTVSLRACFCYCFAAFLNHLTVPLSSSPFAPLLLGQEDACSSFLLRR